MAKRDRDIFRGRFVSAQQAPVLLVVADTSSWLNAWREPGRGQNNTSDRRQAGRIYFQVRVLTLLFCLSIHFESQSC